MMRLLKFLIRWACMVGMFGCLAIVEVHTWPALIAFAVLAGLIVVNELLDEGLA